MEYDIRITSSDLVLNCFDTTFAEEHDYKGKFGYFTNCIEDYADLDKCQYGELTYTNSHAYQLDHGNWYTFFLPQSAIESKKKEYRPYTIEEFCNEGFEIVVFREKEDHSREYHVRYNGYRKAGTEYIILGSWSYTLNDLFNDFEYLDNDGNWKPFGVEE